MELDRRFGNQPTFKTNGLIIQLKQNALETTIYRMNVYESESIHSFACCSRNQILVTIDYEMIG
jgi:hypothetical protein